MNLPRQDTRNEVWRDVWASYGFRLNAKAADGLGRAASDTSGGRLGYFLRARTHARARHLRRAGGETNRISRQMCQTAETISDGLFAVIAQARL